MAAAPTVETLLERVETAERRAEAAEQRAEAAEQRVAELESLLGGQEKQTQALKDSADKNSKNSHLPPSSEGPGHSKGKKPKPKRKRGGQSGHKGHCRELVPTEQVDHWVHYFQEHCAHEEPARCDSQEPVRYQVTEIEGHVAEITEHQAHGKRCTKCQRETWAANFHPKY